MGNLNIIGGELGGRQIDFPDESGLRPSTGLVKESIFNILENLGSPKYYLDLYAGSGALGIEALSRGAESVIFIDKNPVLVRSIKENLIKMDIDDRAIAMVGDLPKSIKKLEVEKSPDCIFVDPPFHTRYPKRTLKALSKWKYLKDDTLIIVRVSTDEKFDAKGYEVLKDREYGENRLLILRKQR